jgi:hypothetical protein
MPIPENTERDLTVNSLYMLVLEMRMQSKEALAARVMQNDQQFITLQLQIDHNNAATRDIEQQMDLRYQQRFDAQGEAVNAALTAAEKAVNAALIAADRAVAKAEVAAEKRFEAVNEFRGTLADQATMLLPRSEADARFSSIAERWDQFSGALSKIELEAKSAVRREDLKPINEAIDKLRDANATHAGKAMGMGTMVTFGLAVLAIMVSLGGILYHSESVNPTVGADTKRVDDLISQTNEQNRQMGARMDALSGRLNQTTVQPK